MLDWGCISTFVSPMQRGTKSCPRRPTAACSPTGPAPTELAHPRPPCCCSFHRVIASPLQQPPNNPWEMLCFNSTSTSAMSSTFLYINFLMVEFSGCLHCSFLALRHWFNLWRPRLPTTHGTPCFHSDPVHWETERHTWHSCSHGMELLKF